MSTALPRLLGITVLVGGVAGCTVLSVAGTAVSIGATAVGAAVDVTVGAARVTGKVIGSAVDAVTSSDDTAAKNAKPQADPTPPLADEPKGR